jgi:hypothetical protein
MELTEHRGACQVVDGEPIAKIVLRGVDGSLNGSEDGLIHRVVLSVTSHAACVHWIAEYWSGIRRSCPGPGRPAFWRGQGMTSRTRSLCGGGPVRRRRLLPGQRDGILQEGQCDAFRCRGVAVV